MLNFSIAYGKTAHGLARDWKTDLEEAQQTVERWYADRPEVRRARVHLYCRRRSPNCSGLPLRLLHCFIVPVTTAEPRTLTSNVSAAYMCEGIYTYNNA